MNTQHTVHSYDKELASLSQSIIEMGNLVRDMLLITNKSLNEHGSNFIDLAKTTDQKINNFDIQIEYQATTLLALRQPMAIDLRQVISALKIAVIMERMGDLAKNTIKRATKIKEPITSTWLNDANKMTNIIIFMLENVLESFKQGDKDKAYEVCAQDQEVDDIYYNLMDLLQNDMVVNPQNIPSTMQVILALKNLERIGDYVTKVARLVHYIVSGERASKESKAE